MPVMSSADGEREQRPEQLLQMRLEPEIEPRLHGVARRAGQMLVGENAHARLQHIVARGELADRLAEPADAAVGGEHELLVRRVPTSFSARASISPASAFCAAARSALPSGPADAGRRRTGSLRAARSGGPRRRLRRLS